MQDAGRKRAPHPKGEFDGVSMSAHDFLEAEPIVYMIIYDYERILLASGFKLIFSDLRKPSRC